MGRTLVIATLLGTVCGAVCPPVAEAQDASEAPAGASLEDPGDSAELQAEVDSAAADERKDAADDLGIIDVKRGGARLEWVWPRFGTEHAIVTGVAGAVVIGTALVPPLGVWGDATIGIDEDVRDAIRLEDPQHGLWARDTSDVLLSLMTSWPLIVDGLIVSAYFRSSPDVAMELALISTETMVVNAAITGIFKMLAGRERPYGRTCGVELDRRTDDCQRRDRERSFFSGHASQTFASAALSCMHHLNLPLYGGGTADTLVCPVAFALAGATATLRVASDRHYFLDVVTGAATGTTVGLLVPWLFFYSQGPDEPETALGDASVTVQVVPTGNGAAIVGAF